VALTALTARSRFGSLYEEVRKRTGAGAEAIVASVGGSSNKKRLQSCGYGDGQEARRPPLQLQRAWLGRGPGEPLENSDDLEAGRRHRQRNCGLPVKGKKRGPPLPASTLVGAISSADGKDGALTGM